MSTLNVDKVDPSTGTDLELGTSGDTVTVPTGAGLTVVDEVKTNKVSPATGTAFALGDSGDTFTVPSGATIVNSGTATGFGITSASFLPESLPIMINGNMAVAQRGTSEASISTGGLAYKTVDKQGYWIGTGGTWTMSQETLTSGNAYDAGFKNALKWDNTTANGSLSAGSYFMTAMPIEGSLLQGFKKGTSNAEVLTLAFWIKSTKTGTFVIELQDADNSRAISQAYTVSSTDTWEHKVLNFVADTSADPWANDNGKSLSVYFWWVAGTNFTSGSLNTSWTNAPTSSTRAVGQVNCADSTSNNIHVTGVQIEVGSYTSSTLPPFKFEGYGDNLARCQRYYQTFGRGLIGKSQSASTGTVVMTFPVHMRATPTVTPVTGSDVIADPGVAAYEITSITGNSSGTQGLYLAIATNGGGSGNFYLGTVDKVGTADADL